MEGGSYSQCGSRLQLPHTLFMHCEASNAYTDGSRLQIEMSDSFHYLAPAWDVLALHAPAAECPTVTRMVGEPGSRLSLPRMIRPNSLKQHDQLQRWRAIHAQNPLSLRLLSVRVMRMQLTAHVATQDGWKAAPFSKPDSRIGGAHMFFNLLPMTWMQRHSLSTPVL